MLEEVDLAGARDRIVEQTAEVLYISHEEAGCLLRSDYLSSHTCHQGSNPAPISFGLISRHYGWRKQQLEAEWFADQRKVRREVGLSVAPEQDPPARVQCQSAYCDVVPVGEAHRLNCGHWFCNDVSTIGQRTRFDAFPYHVPSNDSVLVH